VDGADNALAWLRAQMQKEDAVAPEGSVDYHKQKLRELVIWDAIALHTNKTIVAHYPLHTASVCYRGIEVDFKGENLPALPINIAKAVLEVYPRMQLVEHAKAALCMLAYEKPETTQDNFVGAIAQRCVDGFTLDTSRMDKFIEMVFEHPFELMEQDTKGDEQKP